MHYMSMDVSLISIVQFSIIYSIQDGGGSPGSIYHASDVIVYFGRQKTEEPLTKG